MKVFVAASAIVLVALLELSEAQLPPRFNIPGAVLVGQARPSPPRQQRLHTDVRFRRPPPQAIPAPIRPVVEEPEEAPPVPIQISASGPASSDFDDEVNKLGISVLQSAVRQAAEDDVPLRPLPVAFRPERPLPVLRQDIRENIPIIPKPVPVRVPVRQEIREEIPAPRPQPIRQQARQHVVAQPPPQSFRQAPPPQRVAPAPRPAPQYIAQHDDDDRHTRTRKPVVQILRKFRTDNADGSITWGYENEDGTFKEETLGVDCITRGKYGYIDPDGVRREYSYETGNKCDEPEEEDEESILQAARPQQPHQGVRKAQPQFRPPPGQY